MFWYVLGVLSASVYVIESLPVVDVLRLSNAIIDRWRFHEVTFIDLTDEEFDNDLIDMKEHKYLQPNLLMRFLSSKSMNISPIDIGSTFRPGAVMFNSENSTLLEQISIGLLETVTWFVPLMLDLSRINLRLDSNMYLFSKVNSTTILLHEAYSIKQGPKIRHVILSWSQETGLNIAQLDWRERRKNLSNLTILNALVLKKIPPLSNVTQTKAGIHYEGYMSELLDVMVKVLNVTVKSVIAPDGQFGSRAKNGSWNGMLGMLVEKRADICTWGFIISIDRTPDMDFTNGVLKQSATLMVKRSSGGGWNGTAYLLAFSVGSWIVIGFTILAFLTGLVLVGKFDEDKISVQRSVGVIFISLLQRDHHCFGRRPSSRLMIFVISIFFYMIFAYYSTVITSYMTVLEPPTEISSLSDALKQDYHVIAEKGTLFETLFVNSKPPSIWYDIYHKDMKQRPRAFISVEEILDELDKNPKTAYFGTPFPFLANDLAVLKIPETRNNYLGFVLQKDSELTKVFNYHLLKMRQSGITKKIYSKWFQPNESLAEMRPENVVLSYDNLVFPFFFLLSGVVLGVVVLVLEKMFSKLKCLFEI